MSLWQKGRSARSLIAAWIRCGGYGCNKIFEPVRLQQLRLQAGGKGPLVIIVRIIADMKDLLWRQSSGGAQGGEEFRGRFAPSHFRADDQVPQPAQGQAGNNRTQAAIIVGRHAHDIAATVELLHNGRRRGVQTPAAGLAEMLVKLGETSIRIMDVVSNVSDDVLPAAYVPSIPGTQTAGTIGIYFFLESSPEATDDLVEIVLAAVTAADFPIDFCRRRIGMDQGSHRIEKTRPDVGRDHGYSSCNYFASAKR